MTSAFATGIAAYYAALSAGYAIAAVRCRGDTRTMLLAAALGAAAAVLPSLASPANAAPVCADRASIVDRLETVYSETRQSVGLDGSAQMVEIFASPAGTWTILVTQASGLSCMVAAGTGFEVLAMPGRGA